MKCTLTKEIVQEKLSHIERIAGKTKENPILSCVYLEVKDSFLYMRATNLEIGIEYSLPVKDSEDGVIVVSAIVFSQTIAHTLASAKITLESQENVLIVKSVGMTSKVSLQDAKEFPLIPKIEKPEICEIDAESLEKVLKSVYSYASPSTIKPELSSIFLYVKNKTLFAVATDSFRLAEKKILLKKEASFEPFLIPQKTIQDIVYMLIGEKGDIILERNEHQCLLKKENSYCTFRLTVGTFPSYEQIIPKNFTTKVMLLKKDFERVLKKQSLFSDSFFKTIVRVSKEKSICSVETHNDSIGESVDEISATIEGEDIEISFNYRYLLDSLNQIHTDSCILSFGENNGPLIITPSGDDSYMYIVMPMNR
jgi:DNA polymerase III subunit beta